MPHSPRGASGNTWISSTAPEPPPPTAKRCQPSSSPAGAKPEPGSQEARGGARLRCASRTAWSPRTCREASTGLSAQGVNSRGSPSRPGRGRARRDRRREHRLAEPGGRAPGPYPRRGQPFRPPAEGAGRDRERDLVGEPGAAPSGRQVGPGEEGQVAPGVPLGVGVEQVVGVRARPGSPSASPAACPSCRCRSRGCAAGRRQCGDVVEAGDGHVGILEG